MNYLYRVYRKQAKAKFLLSTRFSRKFFFSFFSFFEKEKKEHDLYPFYFGFPKIFYRLKNKGQFLFLPVFRKTNFAWR